MVIKVSYIKQELSYLPASIVDVSCKLLRVKFKWCVEFSATLEVLVIANWTLYLDSAQIMITLSMARERNVWLSREGEIGGCQVTYLYIGTIPV